MTQPSWRGGEMVDQSHLSHPVLYKWESEGGGPRGRRRRRVAFRRLQFRYSPVDYRPDGVRPTEKGNPLEDANSTTDKLARRHDDTCKMGRQEAGPIPLSLPPSLLLSVCEFDAGRVNFPIVRRIERSPLELLRFILD